METIPLNNDRIDLSKTKLKDGENDMKIERKDEKWMKK